MNLFRFYHLGGSRTYVLLILLFPKFPPLSYVLNLDF